jgi:phage terminase large subunit-like protein
VVLPDPTLVISVGVDVATKRDCAAVVAVARDGDRLRLVSHRIWTPGKREPLDLEETVEDFLLRLHRDHRLHRVRFDPFQMARSAATLRRAGLRLEELPQTSPNLTAASQGLYELVTAKRLTVYPDAELRRHILSAVAIESPRGWRLAKERTSRPIDAAVALSFAALGALELRRGRARRRRVRSGGYDPGVDGWPMPRSVLREQ